MLERARTVKARSPQVSKLGADFWKRWQRVGKSGKMWPQAQLAIGHDAGCKAPRRRSPHPQNFRFYMDRTMQYRLHTPGVGSLQVLP